MKKFRKIILPICLFLILLCIATIPAAAEESAADNYTQGLPDDFNLLGNTDTLGIVITLTLIALLPSILIMTTCFTRIIIVLSCLRSAIGLQQTPPNQVLIGIALFLSLFIMSPTISEINTTAYIPYKNGEITQEAALEKAAVPLRNFMLRQTKEDDLNFFLNVNNSSRPESMDDISSFVIIPAFITSELKRAFIIGLLLYLPFLIIDMVVASTLMSMGMVMLPPTMIALPFKLMLFVLVDGWQLTFQSLITGFN
ncbi:MAG: flagellar type III secretion system pore protein FliP [Eubacteriales bacterium]|nr:flagellar type III secretion system pore protein FliP [Eubacteriales bacterium]MDD4421736.1 flagellar type III secretion system pore protein FliP [Eubacteriales bacterium]